MRLFQNSGVYRAYLNRLAKLTHKCQTYDAAVQAFMDDRSIAVHVLQPILNRQDDAFFANGDNHHAQRLWASENGLKLTASLEEILIAQIEHHRTEIFYNMDPMRYGDAFLKRLPGSVKKTVAWRAAPSQGGAFLSHDIIVNNFPSLLQGYLDQGVRAEYFTPAHDPEMNTYAAREERIVDILFIGTYSRHHRTRAAILEAIAQLRNEMKVVMHLDVSRYTKLAETPLGWLGPLRKDRRSPDVRAVAKTTIFGRDLLDAIGNAKIVVNGAIDMAGNDRGNMRVWEALGCGAALISDAGVYPKGMSSPEHFLTYNSVNDAVANIRALHSDRAFRERIAASGHTMIAGHFSKEQQWARFQEIVA